MNIDNVKSHFEEYEQEAQKISSCLSYPEINKNSLEIETEKFNDNNDYYFNKEGILINSIHYGTHSSPTQLNYAYNHKGLIASVTCILGETNKLIDLTQFEYDENERIVIQRMISYKKEGSEIYLYTHTYNANKETVLETYTKDPENDRLTYITYDNKQRVIEEKIFEDKGKFVNWFK